MINPVDEVEDLGCGITKVRLYSWEGVSLFLQPDIFTELPPEERKGWPDIDLDDYVWRGQRDEFAGLLPGLYRDKNAAQNLFLHEREKAHFDEFKYALRGRCSLDLRDADENDVWALGQAHGLHTPLLDWTTSPYVALYFAFEEPRSDSDYRAAQDEPSLLRYRYLYGLNRTWVKEKARNMPVRNYKWKQVKVFEFPRPLVHDNPHLISQSGLFTRLRTARPIEHWIRANFRKDEPTPQGPVLLIIEITETSRKDCLGFLDRWNINHLSLFPDIRGAAIHRNRAFWQGIPGSKIP